MTAWASGARAESIALQVTAGNIALSGYVGPYADVTVDRTSSTTATVTFTSHSVGGNTYLLGDGGSADLNVNAASWTIGSFLVSNAGTGFLPGPLSDRRASDGRGAGGASGRPSGAEADRDLDLARDGERRAAFPSGPSKRRAAL